MITLKQNTACEIIIGTKNPLTDCVDGKTPIEALTLGDITAAIYKGTTRSTITLTESGADNNLTHIADGYWKLSLIAANVNALGQLKITLRDDDVFLPVSEVFEVVAEPMWSEQKFMRISAAWLCGKWRDKAGSAGTYEILDPDDGSTVILEITPAAASPQKTVVIKI
jgi:hypothetical protein